MRIMAMLWGMGSLLAAAEDVGLERFSTRLRISAEEIKVVDDERMGLVGVGYDTLAPFASIPGFWSGVGFYGGAWGDRGGLFVMGGSVGWRHQLVGPLGFECGGFVGGGGGASAGQGNGLMLRSHAQLGYDLGVGELAAGWAYDTFPGAEIEGHSWTLAWHQHDHLTLITDTPRGGPAFVDLRRWEIMAQVISFWPDGDRGRDGTSLENRLDVIGIGLDRGLNTYFSFPLRFAGTVNGKAGGYMEVLSGLAFSTASTLAFEVAALGGVAGGGNVDTGGGSLVRTEAGFSLNAFKDIRMGVHGGWTWALGGDFDAATAVVEISSTSIEWDLIDSGAGTLAKGAVLPDPWRISVGTTRYDSDVGKDLTMFDVALEKPLTRWLVLTGRGRSAFTGNAGGYGELLLGGRLEWPLLPQHIVGFGIEAGTAGGGGIATDGGAIAAAIAQYRWQFSPSWGLALSVGQLEAVTGTYETKIATLAVVWSAVRALAQ